jgi:hypothetical protein
VTTVSQAESWRPAALDELAGRWDDFAGRLQQSADNMDQAMSASDSSWSGAGADAARRDFGTILISLRNWCRSLVLAAAEARAGAIALAGARDRVLAKAAEARQEGCAVAEDGTVERPPSPAPLLVLLSGGAESAANALLDVRARNLTVAIHSALAELVATDAAVAREIDAALDSARAVPVPISPHPASSYPASPSLGSSTSSTLVAGWPTMSQSDIARQLADMPAEVREQLVRDAPQQLGNTDGVPWEMRFAANRLNIANEILAERRIIDRPEDEKLASAIPPTLGPIAAERLWAMLHVDPAMRAAAVAAHDHQAHERISLYQNLLASVPDPGRPEHQMERQILAFDPNRSSLIEVSGDLHKATSIGVLIPGLNTRWETSPEDVARARRFVTESHGDVAMITYLGGRFPTGDLAAGLADAADPRYALEMAPRLAAFSEDVGRTRDGLGRPVPITYIGHSYGGSIVGTAERFGLLADRVIYVEAAGAGVGVHNPSDWHNRNPHVLRFSLTAPGDWISLVQGLPFGPHGADPDEMPGVIQLAAGRRLNGWPMIGPSTHSDVLTEPSDAWRNILAVIQGDRRNIRVG